ncbi:hypothetical protein SEE436_016805 [Salmonella enterica subsp. enterica serovar Enteritidis str. 436]|nr:hypothetical protein SEE436_016805 [Salmonella enterica subsp. enterica serovar Enteritidis str. 436]
MKLNLITVSLATLVAAGAFPAHAGPQAHVVCGYHHTLGDDAIMMFGKANQAMWHDFFWQHPHRRGLYLPDVARATRYHL